MADIFDELSEDIRAERARAAAKRYGLIAGLAALLLVAGVGAWQGWEWRQGKQAEAAAAPYLDAMRAADALPLGPSPQRTPDADAFAKIASTAPAGYRSLALLREAGLRWDAGDKDAAFALWMQLSADEAADPMLRDLATLLWAQHSVDAGDPAAIAARTGKLEAAGNPWRPLAQEVDALLALRQDDKPKAESLLRVLSVDGLAPDSLRGRATALLTLLGAVPGARG